MFNGAKAFNGDITNWITANVTTMESMFEGASAFNQALTSWDVTKVVASEEYAKMFYGSGLSSTSTNWTSMKQSQPNGWGAMSETILWWLY